jgi:hypothetical protein
VASKFTTCLAAVALTTATAQTTVDYTVIEDASAPRVRESQYRVARQKSAVIVSIFAGEKPTGGYSVQIADVKRTGAACTVRYRVEAPSPDAIVTQALTYPSITVRLPVTCKTIKVDPPLRSHALK